MFKLLLSFSKEFDLIVCRNNKNTILSDTISNKPQPLSNQLHSDGACNNMPKKVLCGYGIDFDAVSGW